MTAIEDANAAADELDRRIDACDLMQAWTVMDQASTALRALIAAYERQSARLAFVNAERRRMLPTQPTDDAREALAEVIWESRIEFSSPGKTPATNCSDVAISAARQSARHTADRILATGFRRQGPITDEWEYSIHTAAGEHIWPLGPQDEEIVETREACEKALGDNDPDYWEPTDRIMRRRKAGPWEPVEADTQ
ncbi:hypothetical protein [Microbacterium jejuense]|uniref:hypothetical protein n=1 Tax=Microbacterium jejuense TaxID=1263637 RepID=UPI0031E77938